MPEIYIIGGPNGAGKTTTALRVFPRLGVTAFINADIIAQGLSPLDVESAARDAGRLMLSEMERHLSRGNNFAIETTLASRSLAQFVRRCKEASYCINLVYIWLESADLAVARVARRVSAGGHDIPEDVIRRRYKRGRENFKQLYMPLADYWLWINNSALDYRLNSYGCRDVSLVADDLFDTFLPENIEESVEIISKHGKEAVVDAIETHRRMGRSIVVSKNGQIKRIRPQDLAPRALPHDEWEKDSSPF